MSLSGHFLGRLRPWGLLLLLAIPGLSQAQVLGGVIHYVDDLPKAPEVGAWYYQRDCDSLKIYQAKGWKSMVKGPCAEIKSCHGMLLLDCQDSLMVVARMGFTEPRGVDGYHCSDKLMGYWNPNILYFYHTERRNLTFTLDFRDGCNLDPRQRLSDGSIAFCVPGIDSPVSNFRCAELHGWGLLDAKGEWRVQPIYDKPFFFENGRADVVLYGERLTINEYGGRVK